MSRDALDQKKRKGAEGPDTLLLQRLANSGNTARFLETAIPLRGCRRLFITIKGFLGLGPDTVKEGDMLCVLAGGDYHSSFTL